MLIEIPLLSNRSSISRCCFSIDCCCSSILSCWTLMEWSVVSVMWSASARASWLAEITFWPTMMIGSRMSYRKDWLSQAMPTTVSPRRNAFRASGNDTSAIRTKR